MTPNEVDPNRLMAEIHDVLQKYIEEEMPKLLRDEKVINLIPNRMLKEVYSIE